MLYEWIAYAEIEPFGEERADLRAGIVASTMANINRQKGKPAYKPQDFMPKFGKQEPQSWQSMLAVVEEINRGWGDDKRNQEQKEWRQH